MIDTKLFGGFASIQMDGQTSIVVFDIHMSSLDIYFSKVILEFGGNKNAKKIRILSSF